MAVPAVEGDPFAREYDRAGNPFPQCVYIGAGDSLRV